ncbi:SDR family oxidoreductase [Pseudomonas subflava]|uniref:SDR family oxidoreductase n=1 Tax=Pseudomonas subflava TaxID=2952933 RepID=UPI002079F8A6|nr:SDR family oxidoreductase [Pseudomonas subflava]
MSDLRSLDGAVVVITGASSGIGRATAQAFARERARLVLASRDRTALADVVNECQRLGAEAVAVPTDVTESEALQHLADRAQAFGGHIDVWINNAGVGSVGGFEDTPLRVHEQVIQTDLLGYLRGAHAVLPLFKKQRRGVLINTLSVGSWVAQPYAVSYSAAKFGLRGFSEALRGELTDWPGIHVCDVYPAVIDTPGFRDGGNYSGHALTPPPPRYDPREVAATMVRLALHPRASSTVGGMAHLLRLAHFLVPGFAQLAGWGTARAIGRARHTPVSSGNLFHPPLGQRRIDGGWRQPASKQTNTLLALGALGAAAAGWYLVRRLNGSSWRR